MSLVPVPVVPTDFPTRSAPAALSGAQPKLALVEVDGRYRYGDLKPDEATAVYEMCEDLAQQMTRYCRRKLDEGVMKDEQAALALGLDGLRTKGWCSDAQNLWVMRRAAELLGWTALNIQAGTASSADRAMPAHIAFPIGFVGTTRLAPLTAVEKLLREPQGVCPKVR